VMTFSLRALVIDVVASRATVLVKLPTAAVLALPLICKIHLFSVVHGPERRRVLVLESSQRRENLSAYQHHDCVCVGVCHGLDGENRAICWRWQKTRELAELFHEVYSPDSVLLLARLI